MTFAELKLLTKAPENLSPLVQALWHDHHGNWEASHNLAQDITTRDGAWVHAYLHRKEGDAANALYWYDCAGKEMPSFTLEKEWEDIAKALLEKDK